MSSKRTWPMAARRFWRVLTKPLAPRLPWADRGVVRRGSPGLREPLDGTTSAADSALDSGTDRAGRLASLVVGTFLLAAGDRHELQAQATSNT